MAQVLHRPGEWGFLMDYNEIARRLLGTINAYPGLTIYKLRQIARIPDGVHNSLVYRVAWDLAAGRKVQPWNYETRTIWYPCSHCTLTGPVPVQ
jgi:hypothetical protein